MSSLLYVEPRHIPAIAGQLAPRFTSVARHLLTPVTAMNTTATKRSTTYVCIP
jgi:hypothetical protein